MLTKYYLIYNISLFLTSKAYKECYVLRKNNSHEKGKLTESLALVKHTLKWLSFPLKKGYCNKKKPSEYTSENSCLISVHIKMVMK